MTEGVMWVTPLVLLPGVGLLIMSTANRFGQIHGEFHHYLHEQHHSSHTDRVHGSGHAHRSSIRSTADVLWRRARLLRAALVSLYGASGLFALAGLIGGLAEASGHDGRLMLMTMTCVGVFLVVFASVGLIAESRLLLGVFRDHYQQLIARQDP